MRWAETTRRSYGDAELVQRLRGVAHRLPVGARAHDQTRRAASPRRQPISRGTSSRAPPTPCARSRAPRGRPRRPPRSPGGAGSCRGRRSRSERDDREPPHRVVRVAGRELVQSGRNEFTSPGWSAESARQRDQRRAARSRALVLEPAPEQLELLAEAELRDRAVRHARAPGSRSSALPPRARRPTACAAPRAPAGRPRVRARPPAPLPRRASRRLQRPRRRPDIARRRPEQPAGPLLLEDVRRPPGHAGAGEHRRRERRRDLCDVEHDRRVVLDVRREHAIGVPLLQRRERDLAPAPPRPRCAPSRARFAVRLRMRERGSSAR